MIWIIRRVYHEPTIYGMENLPDEPCIVVGNHSKTHGPIISQLYFPENSYTWCASQVMHLNTFPDYAFEDFWSDKPKWSHWFWHILSYLIAPFGVCLFTNARTIETCHDSRIFSTFRSTIKALQSGNHVIIFPEYKEKYNSIVNRFHGGFIDIAKLYYKRTGKALKFVPMYIAPRLHEVHLGEPVTFQPEEALEEERERICQILMGRITEIAVSRPAHRVIPYDNNIARRDYPWNTCEGVSADGSQE